MLEAILDKDNLEAAWKRVRANKGAPGMDGMTVAAFPAFARANLPRIMEWIGEEYVEGRLKLLVNREKSKVAPLGECDFLGFNIRGKRIRRTEKAAKRFKLRIQEVTSRSRGISMGQRLVELKRYCVGWFHYFKTGLLYGEALQWDQWIRRRIRLCYWKDWKRPRTRRRMLIRLGVLPDEVKKASRSRKGYPPSLFELWRGRLADEP